MCGALLAVFHLLIRND